MSNNRETSHSLVTFAHIMRCGSLSAAARQMGIGRAAVSKQLRALESKMGVRLIQRSTRHLALTEIGEQVLRQAHIVEQALGAVDAISSEHQSTVSGTLKVSCTSALGRTHLLPRLPNFLQQFPEVSVNLQLEDRFVDLITEQVDVSIRVGFLSDSSLIARQLGQFHWQLCASPDYLAKAGTPDKPADLMDHNCLYYRNADSSMNRWGFIDEEGKEEYVTVDGRLTINDANALVDAAINGAGILHIDNGLLDALKTGELVKVLPNYRTLPGLPVYAVYPARDFLPAKTKAFVDFLVEALTPLI